MTVASTMPVGAELDVRLRAVSAHEDESLTLRARVLRIQHAGEETDLAVEFVDRVETSSNRLQAMIEALRRGEPAAAAGPIVEAPEVVEIAASAPQPAKAPRADSREGLHRALARVEEQLSDQVERGDRAEAALQALRQELGEERERREAAERTLVKLQAELSRLRAERGELERLRKELEDQSADATSAIVVEAEPEPPARPANLVAGTAGEHEAASPARPGAGAAGEVGVELLGPDEIGSRVVFARHLRDGARLRPTERFERFEPVSRLDIRVHDYAKRCDQLAGIRQLAARRLSEEEILRVLFTFFERGLLRVEATSSSGRAS